MFFLKGPMLLTCLYCCGKNLSKYNLQQGFPLAHLLRVYRSLRQIVTLYPHAQRREMNKIAPPMPSFSYYSLGDSSPWENHTLSASYLCLMCHMSLVLCLREYRCISPYQASSCALEVKLRFSCLHIEIFINKIISLVIV